MILRDFACFLGLASNLSRNKYSCVCGIKHAKHALFGINTTQRWAMEDYKKKKNKKKKTKKHTFGIDLYWLHWCRWQNKRIW